MHIPDGFLDAKTSAATAIIAVIGVGFAIRQLRRTFPPRRVPLMGLAAAFIFTAQMLNFPVAGGTSGHLIGAVLAAVLLGPQAAVLVMTSVLILQCFLFADGGVTALGANIFNMAMVSPLVGYGIYRTVCRIMGNSLRSRLLATSFAAWCSTVAASITCAGQLALSGTVNWGIAFPAMANVHILIGVGESLITTLVVVAIAKSRPELLSETLQPNLKPKMRELIGYGLLVSAGMALFIAPFSSSLPDGLERVAERLGFEQQAVQNSFIPSPFPDYTIPGLPSAAASTVLTGLIGLFVAFGLAYLLARKLTPADSTK
jgi:cobalt/nickel transport system permease protein